MNEGLGETINLIRLSDAFRRHAAYKQHFMVESLVQEARHFAANLTYYYGEDPKSSVNDSVAECVKIRLLKMAALAHHLGGKTVELPVSSHNKVMTDFIRKQVMPSLELPVHFVFQRRQYRDVLLSIGKVDPEIQTVLDSGYRGHADFSHEFMHRPENRHRIELQ